MSMNNVPEDIASQDFYLDELDLENFRDYVEETGWKELLYPSDRLKVFEGPLNDDGRPIILSIPIKRGFRDTDDRLLDAINLLSVVEETSPYVIVQKIRSRNLDTIRLRLPIPSNNSPSVESISTIIHGWRDLIAYSACMEEEEKPYFAKPSPIGKQQAEQFLFGHTFRGSFGLTIESRVPAPTHEGQILPLERRIIERITRGLLFVRDAEKNRNSKVISDNFMLGLNANMCNALLEVIQGIQEAGLEYTVSWSPRWDPSPDLSNPGLIHLGKRDLLYIQEAERDLKKDKDQPLKVGVTADLLEGPVIIQGPIIELNSDDPNRRKIVVKWEEGQRITIYLELEDYLFACDAHINSLSISVSGKLKKVRKTWVLEDPHDLKTI
jgi:hypothetical protein